MRKNIIVKSQNSFFTYFSILGFGGVVFFYLSAQLILKATNSSNPLGLSILALFFGIIGAIMLIGLYKLETIIVYSDHVEIKSLLGNTVKKIYFNDIKSWTEIEKQTKYNHWTELTIWEFKSKHKINSALYRNYDELKSAIVSKAPRNIEREEMHGRRTLLYYQIGFLIFALFCIFMALRGYTTKDKFVQPDEVYTLTGILSNSLEIKKSGKTSRKITILLQNYPKFTFEISGAAYSVTNRYDLISNAKIGDTLTLDVKSERYQLERQKQMEKLTQSNYNSTLSVIGLRDNFRNYLSLKHYNEENQQQKSDAAWFYGVFGIIIIGLVVYIQVEK